MKNPVHINQATRMIKSKKIEFLYKENKMKIIYRYYTKIIGGKLTNYPAAQKYTAMEFCEFGQFETCLAFLIE